MKKFEVTEEMRINHPLPKENHIYSMEEATTELMHLYNLHVFLDSSRMTEFINTLVKQGWNSEQIIKAQNKAALQSNFNKNVYVSQRVESSGKVPCQVSRN